MARGPWAQQTMHDCSASQYDSTGVQTSRSFGRFVTVPLLSFQHMPDVWTPLRLE
uniref:Uncharacterized protein n=1 Tax=Hyaloperonospora arabidopsidis (strain Emoy2) TaxID=559515 RepID=M4BZH3_HYAAE